MEAAQCAVCREKVERSMSPRSEEVFLFLFSGYWSRVISRTPSSIEWSSSLEDWPRREDICKIRLEFFETSLTFCRFSSFAIR